MLPPMAARKKETEFNDYFDFLWKRAGILKMSKGRFMKASGLSPQRFSEFSQGTRNITGEYLLKMLGGLGMTPEELERFSGIPFGFEQRTELQFDGFVKSHRVLIEALMRDPAMLHVCKLIVSTRGFWNNPYVKRLISKFTDKRTDRPDR
ncbi:MAG: helix-turn-helix transcriptional regulator [Deltaproteobacteria bacterium]|nr:helix-turn-helix transcriptional regulator [Deltaproteobacteria bacterium]